MKKPPFAGPAWSRRALVVLSVVCLSWALAIAVTGGFLWEIGGWRLASRDPVRPVLFAFVMAGASAALFRRSDLGRDLAWLWQALERVALPGTLLLAGTVFWAGVTWGCFLGQRRRLGRLPQFLKLRLACAVADGRPVSPHFLTITPHAMRGPPATPDFGSPVMP